MLRIQGEVLKSSVRRGSVLGLVLSLGVTAGGCSTDFRRLENPGLAPGERAPLPTAALSNRRNAGAPIAQENWPDSGSRAPLPPVTSNPRPMDPTLSAPLPNTAGLSKPFDRPKPAIAAAPAAGMKAPAPTGQTIEVQAGDSLYALAKRHNVAIADLMDANGLKSPALKPGQKLALPAASSLRRTVVKPGTQVASAGTAVPPAALPAPAPAIAAAPAPPTARPVAEGEWSGSYTLKSGDSLYAIARNHKIKLADLQRANNIADATKVRPGTVLKVPANGQPSVTSDAPVVAAVKPNDAPRPAQIAATPAMPASTPSGNGTIVTPRIINIQPKAIAEAEPQVAAVTPTPPVTPTVASAPTAPPVEAKTAAAAGKFRWPVKGQTLAGFGKRPDGAPNDGINIAVPAGTDVHAASDGIVAYAGSELKGYGNLVLLRHDGGYVTAYAHASDLMVKRGDAVKRGQVIAKAGQSGGVDKPQVHFELRKDSQPIDPTPHMEKM